GAVWAWGWNGSGQLGIGNTTDSHIPTQVPGLSGVSALSGGGYHSLALKSDGSVWAWGDNGDGELGLGNNSNAGTNSPQKIPGLSGVVQMSSGEEHSLVLKSDGTVWAWGDNHLGQLGVPTGTICEDGQCSMSPVQVAGL